MKILALDAALEMSGIQPFQKVLIYAFVCKKSRFFFVEKRQFSFFINPNKLNLKMNKNK